MRCPLTWRCPLTGWTCRLPSWACYFSLWSAVAVSVCVLAVAVEVSRIEVGNLRSPVQLPWPSFTESPGALEARSVRSGLGCTSSFLPLPACSSWGLRSRRTSCP